MVENSLCPCSAV